MSDLAKKILEPSRAAQIRIAYGVMASATTVNIEGNATAVEVPQLASAGALESGDYVALQIVGADALIIGKVGDPPQRYAKRIAYLLDADGEVAITFPTPFAATPVITLAVELATGVVMSTHIDSASATGFTAQVWRNGSPDASVSRVLHWTAEPQT